MLFKNKLFLYGKKLPKSLLKSISEIKLCQLIINKTLNHTKHFLTYHRFKIAKSERSEKLYSLRGEINIHQYKVNTFIFKNETLATYTRKIINFFQVIMHTCIMPIALWNSLLLLKKIQFYII